MWKKRTNTTANNNAMMTTAQASAASHHRNMDNLHAQLGQLLLDAQSLLADIAPGATGGQFDYQKLNGGGIQTAWAGKTSQGMHSMLTSHHPPIYSIVAMQAEIRTLEFWRSIIGECVATFFYVLIVCSVAIISEMTNVADTTQNLQCALSAGLAIAMITQAFSGVSGAHANPAVTMAMILIRYISPLRAILYMCAQCGGGIAGAALVHGIQGVYKDVYKKELKDPIFLNEDEKRIGAFGMEFTLTFLVVYVICASKAETASSTTQTRSSSTGYSNYSSTSQYSHATPTPPMLGVTSNKPNPVIVGAAYAGCLIAWTGSLNPARALGSAFVSKQDYRWNMHWVFWVGPLLGAITGAFAFEYIFNPFRRRGNLSPFSSLTNPSGFGGATATTTTIINTGGGTAGLMTSSSAGAMPGIHNPNQMYMGRSGMGNQVDIPMSQHPDHDLDMLDDLERAKHYKTNAIQDFSDRQSTYGSRYPNNQYDNRGPMMGRGNPMYNDPYSMETKSLYNRGMGGAYDGRDMRSDYYDGSKSMYDGYDGGPDYIRNGMTDVRRSMSVHSKMPPRRNPYDYLPNEPHGMQTVLPPNGASSSLRGGPSNMAGGATNPILSNKPDIMQSVDRDGAATAANRTMVGKTSMNSPGGRTYGHGGYGSDKLDQRGTYPDQYRDTTGYRERDGAIRGGLKTANDILGGVGTNPANRTTEDLMYDSTKSNYPGQRIIPAMGAVGANNTSDGLAATSGYGTRAQQANQRISHLQSTGRIARSSETGDEYGRAGYSTGGTGTVAATTGPGAAGGPR